MSQPTGASAELQKNPSALLVLTAIGIVYGDIGTSPLYAFRECFHGAFGLPVNEMNILGVLSLIFWSLSIVISIKYLQFVNRADNNGEGGVLALTALACFTPGKRQLPISPKIFLALGLFGASLLVGDGMITPAISVLSAIEGLAVAAPVFDHLLIPITVVILIGLFSIQKHGTHLIGSLFGPITLTWFIVLGALGISQIITNPGVFMAVNPYYAFQFLFNNSGESFFVFGTVFLVVTGGEALYADMGHFGRKAVSLGWYFCALPGLLLNYFGQGALLLSRPELASNPFYNMAPSWLLYPLIILATMAAIIASQAIISGLFSITNQCIQMGYCPRLKVIHTSDVHLGQIYVPFVNWLLLIGTLLLVLEFKSSSELSAAYGIAISLDMVITTLLACVVAYQVWNWSGWKVSAVLIGLLTVDLAFAAANLIKIADGGWVPLVIAGVIYFLVTTWKRGREALVRKMRERSYPFENLIEDITLKPPARVSGTAIYMVGDRTLTPPALLHNLKHNKVLHEHVVFLTVVSREIPYVKPQDRVQVTPMAPGFYRVLVQYGFSDIPDIPKLMRKCSIESLGFEFQDPTYFLGREILMPLAERTENMSYIRKKVFTIMARNATVAAHYFKLPLTDVIEVGMEIEF